MSDTLYSKDRTTGTLTRAPAPLIAAKHPQPHISRPRRRPTTPPHRRPHTTHPGQTNTTTNSHMRLRQANSTTRATASSPTPAHHPTLRRQDSNKVTRRLHPDNHQRTSTASHHTEDSSSTASQQDTRAHREGIIRPMLRHPATPSIPSNQPTAASSRVDSHNTPDPQVVTTRVVTALVAQVVRPHWHSLLWMQHAYITHLRRR